MRRDRNQCILTLDFLNLGEWKSRPKYGVKFPPKEIGDKNGLDYAIFELEKPVKNIGKLNVEIRDPGKGESMFILGHPNGDVMRLSRMKCKSDRQNPIAGIFVQHTCETLPGSSGSPGFAERDGMLITLHARGFDEGGSMFNIGISMSALVKESAILQEVFARPENAAQGAQALKSQDPCEAIGLDDGLDLVCRVVDGKVQIGMPPARDLTANNGASVIPLTECDRLAGSMVAKRSGEVEGLFFEDIDGPAAIQACEAAIKEYPQEPHFHIYLARALNAVDDQDPRIWSELELGKAANTQYVTNYQAGLLVDGEAGQEKNLAKGISLYGELCDTGYANACRSLAWRYKNGEGGLSVDLAKAADLFGQACEGGNADACNSLGVMYSEAEVTGEEDEALAVTYFQRACDGGNIYGCRNLAWRYRNGEGGLSVDLAKAADLLQKGCDADHAESCENLADLYEDGEVTGQEDLKRSSNLFIRACDLENSRCNRVGWRYEHGAGGFEVNLGKAAEFYGRACEEGAAESCFSLGLIFARGGEGLPVDEQKAETLLQSACESQYGEACRQLGYNHADETEKALIFFKKACEFEDSVGCAAYAEWVLFQNPAERREFMERGCNLERNADLAGFACAGLVALELEEENYLKAASISMEHFKAGSSGIYDQNYVHSRPPNSTLFHPDFTGYLQQALKAEGYYSGKIDGDFGPKTMSAIEALCECKVAVFH